MAVTPVPAVTPLPTPPQTSDPANFDPRADTFLGALPTFQTQTNAVAANVVANATDAKSNADAAAGAAGQAIDASASAQAAANFKGLWSTQAGAMNKPASVKHNGRFWFLLNNLTNVAASEPGVSSDWTSSTIGIVTQSITSNTTAVPGVRYIFITAGITLTMPTTPLEGDFNEMVNASGGICFINWSGKKVRYLTPTPDPLPFPDKAAIKVSYTTANSGSYA